jgi:hypothetical protein
MQAIGHEVRLVPAQFAASFRKSNRTTSTTPNRLRFFWTRIWGKNIVQWAGRVAELDECYRPFADQLRLLAKGYQSKAILILVERYIETRSGA